MVWYQHGMVHGVVWSGLVWCGKDRVVCCGMMLMSVVGMQYVYTCVCMCACMHVCMAGCMDVWMHGCKDVWMYGWMDGWMDAMHGCTGAWMYVCMYVCMYVRMFDCCARIVMYSLGNPGAWHASLPAALSTKSHHVDQNGSVGFRYSFRSKQRKLRTHLEVNIHASFPRDRQTCRATMLGS